MPTYLMLKPIRFQGKRYKVGEPIEVSGSVAQGLIERRYIAEAEPEAKKPASPKKRRAARQKPAADSSEAANASNEPPNDSSEPANDLSDPSDETKPGIDAADV